MFDQPSKTSRSFEARFPGLCETCGGNFEQGDLIMYEGSDLVHAEPDECLLWTRSVTAVKPCDKCFLVHNGECF